MNCQGCKIEFLASRPDKKYCSDQCYEKDRGINLTCKMCFKLFKGRPKRLYCGMKCAGLSKREALIQRNIEAIKYKPVEGLSRSQIYVRNNPEYTRKYLERENGNRLKVIQALGGKCVKCNYNSDVRALVFDHINSDGKQDRLRIGNRIARYYVNNIEEAKMKIQILCSNCNLIKTFECKEHNTSRRIHK